MIAPCSSPKHRLRGQRDLRDFKQGGNDNEHTSVEDLRRDTDLFLEGTRTNEFQQLTKATFENGFQTREAEMNLARLVSDIQK